MWTLGLCHLGPMKARKEKEDKGRRNIVAWGVISALLGQLPFPGWLDHSPGNLQSSPPRGLPPFPVIPFFPMRHPDLGLPRCLPVFFF